MVKLRGFSSYPPISQMPLSRAVSGIVGEKIQKVKDQMPSDVNAIGVSGPDESRCYILFDGEPKKENQRIVVINSEEFVPDVNDVTASYQLTCDRQLIPTQSDVWPDCNQNPGKPVSALETMAIARQVAERIGKTPLEQREYFTTNI